MSRKTIIWRVVLGIVIAAALAAAGYGIYQWGYHNGAAVACMEEGDIPRMYNPRMYNPRMFGRGFFWGDDEDWEMPKSFRGQRVFTPGGDDDFLMPFHREFYYPNRFPITRTFFSPLSWVFRLVVFGLLIWLIYTVIRVLARGKGWQLSFRSIEDGDEKDKKK
jgi:hypothetical protein